MAESEAEAGVVAGGRVQRPTTTFTTSAVGQRSVTSGAGGGVETGRSAVGQKGKDKTGRRRKCVLNCAYGIPTDNLDLK